MFDKRLFKELKQLKLYLPIGVAASIAAITLIVYQAFTISYIINKIFIEKGLFANIVNSLVLLGVIIIARVVLNGLTEYYNRNSAIKLKHLLREKLITALVSIGPVKLKNDKAGRIASLAQEGIEAMDAYYSEFIPQLLIVTVSIPMILLVVVKQDYVSALIMFITAPLIPVFMILIGKTAEYYNKRQWKALERMSGHFLDVLKGLTTLRLFGKSKAQTEIVFNVSESFRHSTVGVLRISFLSALALELLATLSTAVISVTIGIRLLYGQIHFREAFFILLLAPEYYMPLRQLGAKFHAAMGASAAYDSLQPILEEVINENSLEDYGKENINIDRINISMDDLSFSYDNVNLVISEISMNIKYGERVALVGPSGSGKSTLLSVLMGFVKGYKGSITINDRELREMNMENWRSCFAYVPQHPKIFKNTILENIRMSKPDASFEQVQAAARIAGVDFYIDVFPEKYNTIIGEGGITLSGGQMQLLAIARAYLKGTNVIILDEPTSALDPDTERAFNNALDIVAQNRTIITIAHRIPTIVKSDYIYVMNEGRIVEAGKHDTLIIKKGLYHSLLTAWEVKE